MADNITEQSISQVEKMYKVSGLSKPKTTPEQIQNQINQMYPRGEASVKGSTLSNSDLVTESKTLVPVGDSYSNSKYETPRKVSREEFVDIEKAISTRDDKNIRGGRTEINSDTKPQTVDLGEVLKPSDKLIVDPELFKGQFQPDGDLCNYLAFAAQIHLCQPDESQAEVSKKVLKDSGILKVSEMVRRQMGTPRLSNFQAQEEFKKRTGVEPIYGASGLKESGIWKEGDNIGKAMVTAISKEGMLPSILLMNENHAVLGIGVSEDNQEIIAWDALTGRGNPRLRRISVDRDQMGMMIASKVNPVFKNSK